MKEVCPSSECNEMTEAAKRKAEEDCSDERIQPVDFDLNDHKANRSR